MLMVCLHFATWAHLSSTSSTRAQGAQGAQGACHLTDLLTQSTGGQIMDHQLRLKDFVWMKLWPHQKDHLSSQKALPG